MRKFKSIGEFDPLVDRISFANQLAFERVWQIHRCNESAAVEAIHNFLTDAETDHDIEVARDMLQIIIANDYDLQADLENLKRKYNITDPEDLKADEAE